VSVFDIAKKWFIVMIVFGNYFCLWSPLGF